jgi:acyl phosphate:glycerol-3-phosphate acyltransferase
VPIVGYILTAVVAYLLGSIPTGFLVAKSRGIDIRTVGSGNIGATNVLRALGKPAGIAVLLIDALKGWLAVAVAARLLCGWLAPAADAQTREWFALCAGISVILGHNYTCWLYFKGGKGIATSAGVVLALVPLGLLIILVTFIIVLALTRYVSLASISAAFVLPFGVWLTGQSTTMIIVTAVLGALAIYKHKANITRLLNGTENRFGCKKPPSAEPAKS